MLGLVSLLVDISSEVIHGLLLVLMVTALDANAFYIGLIEGIIEATALTVKVFSGALIDYLGKCKGIAMLGYVLGALPRPFFALAPEVGVVLAARLTDRIGKGIRGIPHDTLVADIAPSYFRGAAFELRQSLNTVGVSLNPPIAVGLMFLWANDFKTVFRVVVILGILPVLLLLVGAREPDTHIGIKWTNPIRWANFIRSGCPCWQVVVVGTLSMLARSNEAFLVLRPQQVSPPLYLVPLVLVTMNVVYSLSAYSFGKLSDRLHHATLLAWDLGVLILADLVLAVSAHWITMFAGVTVWDLHVGMTQGLFTTMIANIAPEDLRGTVFGFFDLAGGLALLVASALVGLLWDQLRAAFIFCAGATFCVTTITLVVPVRCGVRRLSLGEMVGTGRMHR